MNLPWKRTNSNVTTRPHRFDSMSSPIQQLFEDFWSDFPTPLIDRMDRTFTNFVPKLNIAETEKEYKVTAELPGLKEEDFEISLDDNILRIRGEKKTEQTDTKYAHYEASYGSFERAIQLPSDVNADSVTADLKDGVLTLTIPKVENSPRSRKIQIGKGKDTKETH